MLSILLWVSGAMAAIGWVSGVALLYRAMRRYLQRRGVTAQTESGTGSSLSGGDEGPAPGLLDRIILAFESALSLTPRSRVMLAFPCPSCHQPLLGRVTPGEELLCPWCQTCFQTPEPPPIPPPRPIRAKPMAGARQPFSLRRIIMALSTTLGAGILLIMAGFAIISGKGIWYLLGFTLTIAWVTQALVRRYWHKKNFLPESMLQEGGGQIFFQEALRTVRILGFPVALVGLLAIVGGCLTAIVAGVMAGFQVALAGR